MAAKKKRAKKVTRIKAEEKAVDTKPIEDTHTATIPEQTLPEFSAPEVRSATPIPLTQSWLTLSDKREDFAQALFMTDLFNNPTLSGDKRTQALGIWGVLARAGFYLHPSLEEQYKKQQTCFFCGGQILIQETAIGTQAQCSSCQYLYSEE